MSNRIADIMERMEKNADDEAYRLGFIAMYEKKAAASPNLGYLLGKLFGQGAGGFARTWNPALEQRLSDLFARLAKSTVSPRSGEAVQSMKEFFANIGRGGISGIGTLPRGPEVTGQMLGPGSKLKGLMLEGGREPIADRARSALGRLAIGTGIGVTGLAALSNPNKNSPYGRPGSYNPTLY